MINKIFFPRIYLFEVPGINGLNDIEQTINPGYYPLKEDPYFGIEANVERKINSKYLFNLDKDRIFFYYSKAFLVGPYTRKPIFPYFKGIIFKEGENILIQGKLKYHNVINILLSTILLASVVAILILKLSYLYLLAPIFIVAITKISSRNLERELINDLHSNFKLIN